ncbi:hypothetical protein [Candidatus Kuenenia stuttgartiensis]|uniref:hypothetical protein n=1 Tax=Kuenenia stuttgartiensis TaxID=174633 RepID=UPI00146F903D|nr:hypothetical protein [Candidatus Kuenenia stuttgartiensis]
MLILVFIGLAVNLCRIQVLEHDKYLKLAKAQQSKKVALSARRGLILDRNGRKLAESLRVGSVYANPSAIKDVSLVASHLSKVLHLNPSKVSAKLEKDKKFVWIKRRVSDEELKEIRKLSLQGVYIEHEYQRFYQNGPLGSHVIGSRISMKMVLKVLNCHAIKRCKVSLVIKGCTAMPSKAIF